MAEIFHECRTAGRTFTQKEWGEYCYQTRNGENRVTTQIGKHLWNDFDICMNPDVMSLVVDGRSYGYFVTIKWADCCNGFWASAIDYGYGDGGGGSGVSYADRIKGEKYDHRSGYRSEADAKLAACDAALAAIGRSVRGDQGKLKRLIRMVEDYRKSIKPKFVQLDLFGEMF